MRKYGSLALILFAAPFFAAAQAAPGQDIFAITVTAPTSPEDVQVRYFLSGDPAVQQASSAARPGDNRIVVETSVAGKPAKGFRAIVYSPGCQFATISADDLSASNREARFECQKLSTTSLHGKADVSRFAGKQLEVEALYVCRWAGDFFHVPGLAISPFSVGTAKVGDDGSFALDLPDFSADPLWNKLSHNATLTLTLVDASSGERLGRLASARSTSRGSGLKIAATYPGDMEFTVR